MIRLDNLLSVFEFQRLWNLFDALQAQEPEVKLCSKGTAVERSNDMEPGIHIGVWMRRRKR